MNSSSLTSNHRVLKMTRRSWRHKGKVKKIPTDIVQTHSLKVTSQIIHLNKKKRKKERVIIKAQKLNKSLTLTRIFNLLKILNILREKMIQKSQRKKLRSIKRIWMTQWLKRKLRIFKQLKIMKRKINLILMFLRS